MRNDRINLSTIKGMNVESFTHQDNEAIELINVKPTENGLEMRNGAKTVMQNVTSIIQKSQVSYGTVINGDYGRNSCTMIDANRLAVVYGKLNGSYWEGYACVYYVVDGKIISRGSEYKFFDYAGYGLSACDAGNFSSCLYDTNKIAVSFQVSTRDKTYVLCMSINDLEITGRTASPILKTYSAYQQTAAITETNDASKHFVLSYQPTVYTNAVLYSADTSLVITENSTAVSTTSTPRIPKLPAVYTNAKILIARTGGSTFLIQAFAISGNTISFTADTDTGFAYSSGSYSHSIALYSDDVTTGSKIVVAHKNSSTGFLNIVVFSCTALGAYSSTTNIIAGAYTSYLNGVCVTDDKDIFVCAEEYSVSTTSGHITYRVIKLTGNVIALDASGVMGDTSTGMLQFVVSYKSGTIAVSHQITNATSGIRLPYITTMLYDADNLSNYKNMRITKRGELITYDGTEYSLSDNYPFGKLDDAFVTPYSDNFIIRIDGENYIAGLSSNLKILFKQASAIQDNDQSMALWDYSPNDKSFHFCALAERAHYYEQYDQGTAETVAMTDTYQYKLDRFLTVKPLGLNYLSGKLYIEEPQGLYDMDLNTVPTNPSLKPNKKSRFALTTYPAVAPYRGNYYSAGSTLYNISADGTTMTLMTLDYSVVATPTIVSSSPKKVVVGNNLYATVLFVKCTDTIHVFSIVGTTATQRLVLSITGIVDFDMLYETTVTGQNGFVSLMCLQTNGNYQNLLQLTINTTSWTLPDSRVIVPNMSAYTGMTCKIMDIVNKITAYKIVNVACWNADQIEVMKGELFYDVALNIAGNQPCVLDLNTVDIIKNEAFPFARGAIADAIFDPAPTLYELNKHLPAPHRPFFGTSNGVVSGVYGKYYRWDDTQDSSNNIANYSEDHYTIPAMDNYFVPVKKNDSTEFNPIYDTGYAGQTYPTTLNANIVAGNTQATAVSNANLAAGQTVVIDGESRVISTIDAANKFTVTAAWTNAHTSTTPIYISMKKWIGWLVYAIPAPMIDLSITSLYLGRGKLNTTSQKYDIQVVAVQSTDASDKVTDLKIDNAWSADSVFLLNTRSGNPAVCAMDGPAIWDTSARFGNTFTTAPATAGDAGGRVRWQIVNGSAGAWTGTTKVTAFTASNDNANGVSGYIKATVAGASPAVTDDFGFESSGPITGNGDLILLAGVRYILKFKAKHGTTAGNGIEVFIWDGSGTDSQVVAQNDFWATKPLTTSWQDYTYEFTPKHGSTMLRLRFDLDKRASADKTGDYYIGNISIREADIFRAPIPWNEYNMEHIDVQDVMFYNNVQVIADKLCGSMFYTDGGLYYASIAQPIPVSNPLKLATNDGGVFCLTDKTLEFIQGYSSGSMTRVTALFYGSGEDDKYGLVADGPYCVLYNYKSVLLITNQGVKDIGAKILPFLQNFAGFKYAAIDYRRGKICVPVQIDTLGDIKAGAVDYAVGYAIYDINKDGWYIYGYAATNTRDSFVTYDKNYNGFVGIIGDKLCLLEMDDVDARAAGYLNESWDHMIVQIIPRESGFGAPMNIKKITLFGLDNLTMRPYNDIANSDYFKLRIVQRFDAHNIGTQTPLWEVTKVKSDVSTERTGYVNAQNFSFQSAILDMDVNLYTGTFDICLARVNDTENPKTIFKDMLISYDIQDVQIKGGY